MAMLKSRKMFWTIIGFSTCAALLWPLAVDRTCSEMTLSPRTFVLGDEAHAKPPSIGNHLCMGIVSGVLLAVFVDPRGRFDATVLIHRWARRYALAVGVQSLTQLIGDPLFLAACPTGAAHFLFGFIRMAATSCGYVASQAILCYVTLLRLRVLAPGASTMRASHIFWAMVLAGGASGVLFALDSSVFGLGFLVLLFLGLTLLLYSAFQGHALVIFARTAAAARAEAQRDYAIRGRRHSQTIAARSVMTVWLLAASAVTTLLFMVLTAAAVSFNTLAANWACEVGVILDVPFDAALTLVCAGLAGPTGDRQEELATVARKASDRRARAIREKLQNIYASNTLTAAMVAALIEDKDVEQLIEKAALRFRRVSWDVLKTRPEIILDGGLLSDVGKGADDLRTLAESCELAGCDCFLSHSWRDDAKLKWEQLSSWCEDFRTKHGRPPTLWLDKLCIDQTNISQDLQCLPIFLSGCDRMLVLAGPTYHSRLWCIVELFVYVSMVAAGDNIGSGICFIPLLQEEVVLSESLSAWIDFDAAKAQCFDPRDKKKMLTVISQCHHVGGIAGFNAAVAEMLQSVSYAMSSERSDAMQTMIGAIARISTKRFGKVPTVNDDDSPTSSLPMGLYLTQITPTEPPPNVIGNHIDFDEQSSIPSERKEEDKWPSVHAVDIGETLPESKGLQHLPEFHDVEFAEGEAVPRGFSQNQLPCSPVVVECGQTKVSL